MTPYQFTILMILLMALLVGGVVVIIVFHAGKHTDQEATIPAVTAVSPETSTNAENVLAVLLFMSGEATINHVNCVGGVSGADCEESGFWRHWRHEFVAPTKDEPIFEIVFDHHQCAVMTNRAWCCDTNTLVVKSLPGAGTRPHCFESVASEWYDVNDIPAPTDKMGHTFFRMKKTTQPH